MSGETITLIWLAVGLLLCASELIVPGLVTIFLGIAALGVSLLRWIGVIEGLPASFITWVVSSLVMIVALRRVAVKWTAPETSRGEIDETAHDFGQEVLVLADASESSADGRIRYQGTSWPATTTEGTIEKGQTARIVYRDNLSFVIEPADQGPQPLPEPAEETVPAQPGKGREVH